MHQAACRFTCYVHMDRLWFQNRGSSVPNLCDFDEICAPILASYLPHMKALLALKKYAPHCAALPFLLWKDRLKYIQGKNSLQPRPCADLRNFVSVVRSLRPWHAKSILDGLQLVSWLSLEFSPYIFLTWGCSYTLDMKVPINHPQSGKHM